MRQLLSSAGDGKIDDGEQGHGDAAALVDLAIFDGVYILYNSLRCARNDGVAAVVRRHADRLRGGGRSFTIVSAGVSNRPSSARISSFRIGRRFARSTRMVGISSG